MAQVARIVLLLALVVSCLPRDAGAQEASAEEQLANRFAPIAYLREQDTVRKELTLKPTPTPCNCANSFRFATASY